MPAPALRTCVRSVANADAVHLIPPVICRSHPNARLAAVYSRQPVHWRHHSSDTKAPSFSSSSSSVSASEVSHFNALASSWWDPHGPSRLLHLMNPLRHDFIRSCLQSSVQDTDEKKSGKYRYLDIGCGGGIFASSAARLPNTSSVMAIDPTESVIQVAQQHQRSDPDLNATSNPGKLTYLNCAIEDLPSDTQQFDVISLFEVIEHVTRPAQFLRLCLPHLRPGGWLVGSTISRHPLSYITTKLVAEAPWPLGVVPRGTHDWDKYINPNELEDFFLQEEGEERFGPIRIQGVVYLPLVGWKFMNGSQEFGNYFFGIQKLA